MKKKRQLVISDLIKHKNIATQEALKDELVALGFKVTQATVSRDINEMNLVKTLAKDGTYKYSQLESKNVRRSPLEELHSVLGSLVQSIDYAMNTVVIKCQTGMAQAVCAKLDAAKLPQIVGTLAGDDTIFVLVKNEQSAVALAEELKNDVRA